jgi:hypothetical protein
VELLFLPVVNAEKVGAHADGPGLRRHIKSERFLHFVEDLQRVAAFAVDLVDKGDDRDVAQPTNFKQLASLGLDALSRIDHHNGSIHGGQRAVGVFGKVFVARRVEKVVDDALALERHDG